MNQSRTRLLIALGCLLAGLGFSLQSPTKPLPGADRAPDSHFLQHPAPLPRPESSPQVAWTIEADSPLPAAPGQSQRVYRGNVRVQGGPVRLSCEELVVYLGRDGGQIDRIEARRGVSIQLSGPPSSRFSRASADEALLLPSSGRILLSGWPSARTSRSEEAATAPDTRMTLFTRTGSLLTEGRTESRSGRQLMASRS